MAWPSASERVCEVSGGGIEAPQWERVKKERGEEKKKQAAGIKVKWRRGITQLRFRFSFDCKKKTLTKAIMPAKV